MLHTKTPQRFATLVQYTIIHTTKQLTDCPLLRLLLLNVRIKQLTNSILALGSSSAANAHDWILFPKHSLLPC